MTSDKPAPLWRETDFALLWTGQTVSVLGSLISAMGLGLAAILTLKATPFQISLLALAALVSVLNNLFESAQGAYLPVLVGEPRLIEANSKMAASSSVAQIVGFSAAGWLVQFFGVPVAVGIDAATFLVSAICLARIRHREPPRVFTDRDASPLGELTAGMRTVARNPFLLGWVLANTLMRTAFAVFGTFYLLHASRTLGFSPGVLGLIFALGGVTSLFGTMGVAWCNRRFGFGNTLVMGMLLIALGITGIPLAPSGGIAAFVLYILNQCVTDPGYALVTVNEASLRQSLVPNAVLGRVNAAQQMLQNAGVLAGILFAGFAGERFGTRTTMAVGVGLMYGAVLPLLICGMSRLRVLPPHNAA